MAQHKESPRRLLVHAATRRMQRGRLHEVASRGARLSDSQMQVLVGLPVRVSLGAWCRQCRANGLGHLLAGRRCPRGPFVGSTCTSSVALERCSSDEASSALKP